MHAGTICDFDNQGEFGLIETDDGIFVCFSRKNIALQPLSDLHVGEKVAFSIDTYAQGAHVTSMQLLSAKGATN
jgi:cold shock CspA family protein